jgi:hypothetical protein
MLNWKKDLAFFFSNSKKHFEKMQIGLKDRQALLPPLKMFALV